MSETYTPEQIEAVARQLSPTMRRWLTQWKWWAPRNTARALRKRGLICSIDGETPTPRGEAVAAYLREKEQTR